VLPGLGRSLTWRRGATLAAVTALLLGAFLFTRFGNERGALYTPADRAAVTYVYGIAHRGDVIAAGNVNLPWEDRGYSDYHFALVRRLVPPPAAPETPERFADRVARAMRQDGHGNHAYLVITRSQVIYDEMEGAPVWSFVRDLQRGAELSPRFRLIYDKGGAQVFEVTTAR
jgi:hypothetical protein